MSKITHVASARKPAGLCQACSQPIEKGQAYKHVSVGFRGRKQSRHEDCPTWRPSELESNDSRSTALAAFEAAEDELNALEGEVGELADVVSILEQCAEGVREAAQSWREKAENIEQGFGHATSASEELTENADATEAAADELESAAQSELEDFEGGTDDEGDAEDAAGQDAPEPADDDTIPPPSEEKQEWWDQLIQTARDCLSNAEGNLP